MWDGIHDGLRRWRADGTRFALATVVRTWRSAPRQPGAAMAVSADGEVLGSISGGCVEADVYEVAGRVLDSGTAEHLRYGVTDADAFAVGLTCGGEIEVFVEVVDESHFADFDRVLDRLGRQEPVAVATWVSGPDRGTHLVLDPDSPRGASGGFAAHRLGALLGTSVAQLVDECELPSRRESGRQLFLQASAPPPRMIVFGAVDFAAAMTRIGSFLGYRVTVCDARPVFATAVRFPAADEVVVDWPHRYLATQDVDPTTVLCVLTHDPKFDVPLLEVALRSEAGYVGVMGSRASHADRVRRLREIGVPEADLARLRAPIGLDLGARTPEETAVSIAAEIIAATTGRTGRPLRDVGSAIHAAAHETMSRPSPVRA
jgi:xanthine dehydrogenase accessory factor